MLLQRKDLSESTGIKKNFQFLIAEEGEVVEDECWYHLTHWLSPNFLKINTCWDKDWILLTEDVPVVDVKDDNRRQNFLVMADQPAFRIYLEREPYNPQDSNAIKVMGTAFVNQKYVHAPLGYLSKEITTFLKDKGELDARPHSVYLPYEGQTYELKIKVLTRLTTNTDPTIVNTKKKQTGSSSNLNSNKMEHRWWLLIVGFFSVLLRDLFPFVPLIFGVVLLACLTGAAIPQLQTYAFRILKIDSVKFFEKVLRISLCGIAGFTLVIVACSVYYGNWNDRRTRQQTIKAYEADTTYNLMIADAFSAADSGDLSWAILGVETALAIPDVTDYKDANDLYEQLKIATNPDYALSTLLELPEKDFAGLRDIGVIPSYFFSGHDGLDKKMKETIRSIVEKADKKEINHKNASLNHSIGLHKDDTSTRGCKLLIIRNHSVIGGRCRT